MSALGEYNKHKDYDDVLNLVHTHLKNRLLADSKIKHERAKLIQQYLQEIKRTAIAHREARLGRSALDEAFNQEYWNIIEQSFSLLNQARNAAGLNGLGVADALFQRHHRGTVSFQDDIAEEEFAALFAAIEMYWNNSSNIDLNNFFMGGTTGTVTAATAEFQDTIRQGLEQYVKERKIQLKDGMTGNKKVTAAAGKGDVRGSSSDNAQIIISEDFDDNPIKKLAALLQGATFSIKNYSSYNGPDSENKDVAEIMLTLGRSNLYKAITGSLSEFYTNPKTQRDIFYRGLQILTKTKETPSASARTVEIHFQHMRFMFELRGSGLVDKDGHSLAAHYIIYNDPASEKVYVQDTATIVLDAFEKEKRSSLFGEITVSASAVAKD